MKHSAAKLALLFALASPAFGQTAHYGHHGAAVLPDDTVTPGMVRTTNEKEICTPSFRTKPFRKTTQVMKNHVYATYGVERNKGMCKGGCEVDHRIPLELGGLDDERNLWPQPPDRYLTGKDGSSGSSVGIPNTTDNLPPATLFPHHVLGVVLQGPEEEVGRIYAMPDIAAVENIEAFGNGSISQLPSDPMGTRPTISASTNANHSVTIVIDASGPKPTVMRLMDFGPEPLLNWDTFRPWSAHKLNSTQFSPGWQTKDKLENALKKAVCKEHRLTLAEAQKQLLGDWFEAYLKLRH